MPSPAVPSEPAATGSVNAETDVDLEQVRSLIAEIDPHGNLIALLQRAQESFGYLPEPVVDEIARLSGIPASRGVYTGRARVIRSLSEFNKMEPGDVLVIPYSDVGWTPLFARAGGVIAESGGLLSHSSIIAREYHIPAVVSVADATLLQDNTLVTVDGFKGEILIHRNGDEHGRIEHGTGSQPAAQAV